MKTETVDGKTILIFEDEAEYKTCYQAGGYDASSFPADTMVFVNKEYIYPPWKWHKYNWQ